jgi:hypothetical protein
MIEVKIEIAKERKGAWEAKIGKVTAELTPKGPKSEKEQEEAEMRGL